VERSHPNWSQTEIGGDWTAVGITEINFEINNSKSGDCFPQMVYHIDRK
jgi:hypothetical protein